MTVGLILEEKGVAVLSIDGQSSLADAIKVMSRERVGCLIVTYDDQPLAGILSERDIVYAISEHGSGVLDSPIADYMTRDITTVTPQTPVAETMEIMTRERIRHLPVMDADKLCGLVSIGDVVKRRIQMSEAEAAALKDYITSG